MPILLGGMPAGHITTFEKALAAASDGSGVTMGPATGSTILEQRAERVTAGATVSRRVEGAHEVLFVVGGRGTLHVAGEAHPLEPETGAFAVDGDELRLENTGTEPLDLVAVRTPAERTTAVGRRRIVRYAEQPALSAGIGREFRLLVDQEVGCRDATQFVGVIPPGRAAMHNHAYDEVAFIVEGEGAVHWEDGTSVPVRRGSCIHFPRRVLHSLENQGSTPLRVMGVFHPAGSPAERVDEEEE
jgi:mannose-6-phosphate isomerase-like protein (cupin superfamily)